MGDWTPINQLPPEGQLIHVKLYDGLGAYAFPFDCSLCSDGKFYNVSDPKRPVQLAKRVVAWKSAYTGTGDSRG